MQIRGCGRVTKPACECSTHARSPVAKQANPPLGCSVTRGCGRVNNPHFNTRTAVFFRSTVAADPIKADTPVARGCGRVNNPTCQHAHAQLAVAADLNPARHSVIKSFAGFVASPPASLTQAQNETELQHVDCALSAKKSKITLAVSVVSEPSCTHLAPGSTAM